MLNEITFEGLPAGGVHVDHHFAHYLEERGAELILSNELQPEDLQYIVCGGKEEFKQIAKLEFSDPNGTLWRVKIGDRKLDSKVLPVRKGVYSFTGFEFAKIFNSSIDLIVATLKPYLDDSLSSNKQAYLMVTGGLGENLYLQKKVQELCKPGGLILSHELKFSESSRQWWSQNPHTNKWFVLCSKKIQWAKYRIPCGASPLRPNLQP
ncbi:hypothetical protein DL93DRAFT_1964081 [Clavulina sp. PMI_390]|nr:hypothetical protein DL93DRAFT_1964081 [Clavulina sp. PMI_390]